MDGSVQPRLRPQPRPLLPGLGRPDLPARPRSDRRPPTVDAGRLAPEVTSFTPRNEQSMRNSSAPLSQGRCWMPIGPMGGNEWGSLARSRPEGGWAMLRDAIGPMAFFPDPMIAGAKSAGVIRGSFARARSRISDQQEKSIRVITRLAWEKRHQNQTLLHSGRI